MKFGKKLKELMVEFNKTQNDIAKATGYTQRAVSKWINEESEPSATAVFKCAEYFNVTSDYLLGLEDDFGARTDGGAGVLNSSDLTDEERQLVTDYRSLTPMLKDMIKRTMDIYTKRTVIGVQ